MGRYGCVFFKHCNLDEDHVGRLLWLILSNYIYIYSCILVFFLSYLMRKSDSQILEVYIMIAIVKTHWCM